jgi:hypothetical protein
VIRRNRNFSTLFSYAFFLSLGKVLTGVLAVRGIGRLAVHPIFIDPMHTYPVHPFRQDDPANRRAAQAKTIYQCLSMDYLILVRQNSCSLLAS